MIPLFCFFPSLAAKQKKKEAGLIPEEEFAAMRAELLKNIL